MSGDRALSLTRHFACSPEVLFGAWTDPTVLPTWFGPEGFTCDTHHIDIREGGEWRFTMKGMGTSFPNRHQFTVIEPSQRIEFLMDDDNDESQANHVVIMFAPENSGTLLTQIVVFPTVEAKTEAVASGAEALGYTTLDKLARAVGA